VLRWLASRCAAGTRLKPVSHQAIGVFAAIGRAADSSRSRAGGSHVNSRSRAFRRGQAGAWRWRRRWIVQHNSGARPARPCPVDHRLRLGADPRRPDRRAAPRHGPDAGLADHPEQAPVGLLGPNTVRHKRIGAVGHVRIGATDHLVLRQHLDGASRRKGDGALPATGRGLWGCCGGGRSGRSRGDGDRRREPGERGCDSGF
jgi:hypothetical protein